MADVTLTYKGNTIAALNDSGSKTIRTAGKFCEADIGVEYVKPSGGDEKFRALINRTITEVEDDTITWLKARVFDGCTLLNKVKLPNVTGINGYVFSNVPANLSFQSLESLYGYAFHTSKATAIDLNGNINFYIQVSCFQNASNLSTLVLRRTSKVVSLTNINAFSGTRFASGGSGGTLYVPQVMVDSYQSATNWSTILSYANNQILPIEGSIYETQYADGTPISTT